MAAPPQPKYQNTPQDYQKGLNDLTNQMLKSSPGGPFDDLIRKAARQSFNQQWQAQGYKIPPAPGSPEEAVDKLIQNAQDTRTQNASTIDEWLKGAQPQLTGAAQTANAGEGAIVSALAGAGGTANTAETNAINDLIKNVPGAVTPESYTGDVSSVAAGAKASPEAMAYQSQALQKLSGLTDPTVTAKERFLEMQARQQEEQSRKAAQDAALADLARRGIRSGGAEIAALQGAQQTTSQNRLMQDLGTQAGAVDRSMAAIKGLGELSSTARGQSFDESFKTGSAADDISKFNSKQKADYQQWKDKFQADQANDVWGRTKDVANARTAGASDIYGRNKDVLATAGGAVKDAYGRTQDQINLGQTATGMKVGANTQGGQQTGQALQTGVGLSAEEQAIASLKKKGGLFGGNIIPGVL